MKLRQIPKYKIIEFRPQKSEYCICIPVINEGDRIHAQLKRMLPISKNVDVIILDKGSTDNSLESNFLREMNIKALMIKQDQGGLSAQLRMGYHYALEKNYKGVVTIDGNNKDSVENIYDFIDQLEGGYDYVQGSRFIKGGKAINTPLMRYFAIKLIHAPIVSILSKYKYTDTTNGFRGYSKKLLSDENLSIFRDVFDTYELLPYIACNAPKYGFKVIEIPVTRAYPTHGKIPTKINIIGYLKLLIILWKIAINKYNPQ